MDVANIRIRIRIDLDIRICIRIRIRKGEKESTHNIPGLDIAPKAQGKLYS